ncbi:MAG: RNA-directed DNA polymerase [Candidatus Komeilibacteria bacterium]|nr:RNA-directed DNA polymerase [Candidatus Komeilibacteria bacterium]
MPHRAVKKLESFTRKESQNYNKIIYCLKCDIKRFFDSIDQRILFSLIKKEVIDQDTLWLIQKIIGSFAGKSAKGLPLGNVTSQLFANIYLNKFDQFIKRDLKIQYYLRYCDDFIIIHQNREYLSKLISVIEKFLKNSLKLALHPNKVFIRKLKQGFDFLGYIVLPYHIILRTKTKRRMFKKMAKKKQEFLVGKISEQSFNQSTQSYLGVLSHCKGYELKKKIKEIIKT